MRMLQALRSWTAFHFLLLLGLLFVAVSFSGSNNNVRIDMQNSVFDQFNRIYPREGTDQLIIVDIDEKSLAQYGQWPWPRNIMAGMVDRLTAQGAKVIAFDGLFAEEDRASPDYFYKTLPDDMKASFKSLADLDYDRDFAEAIKRSGIFITAFTYGRMDRGGAQPIDKKRLLMRSNISQIFLKDASHFDAAAINLPLLSEAAAGNGSFMARPDRDGVLRKAGLIFTDGKTLYPSLNLEALRIGVLGRKGTIRVAETPDNERGDIDTNYRIVIGDHVIPVESTGLLHVYYRYFCNEEDFRHKSRNCTGVDYISASRIMDDAHWQRNKRDIEGKIVLIGASAEGLKDLRSTPLQPFRPGVEVHANVIEQVLQGKYLLRPSITQAVEAAFILALGLFFILLAPFIGVGISLLLCLAMVATAVFAAFWMYTDYGILVDPVYPSLAVVSIFIVSTILSYARVEARRKQTRNAFGMYVARDVLRDLERNPEKLKLGGERRDLTVMFTDIRKFTTICEGLAPEELIQLMNDFLTEMTDIVMRYEGTVDKYIGDAMMAFWNAPRDVPHHQRQACLAALQMQAALAPINEKIKLRMQKSGKEPVLLQAGIGLNTGACAVGNMGSRQRFAYSALGDAVNLASRLEGQTKLYGVNILIGEHTYEAASDLAALELDILRVVGKNQPVRVYGLFGDKKLAASQAFMNWRSAHEQFLNLYRARDFDGALDGLKECKTYSGEQGAALYDLYKTRIKSLKKESLPADWDGVFEAKSK